MEQPRSIPKHHKAKSDVENNETKIESFEVPFGDKSIKCKHYLATHSDSKKASKAKQNNVPSLIFTHGAGGGIDNPATVEFAEGFASVDSIVLYQGNMNLQSRIKYFQAVSEHQNFSSALGGRSMGARAAVMSANEHGGTKALVLVSYPLVSEKNNDVREQIILDIADDVDVLFVSGDNDKMCDLAHLNEMRSKMKAKTWLAVVKGADHGMSMRSKDAITRVRQRTGEIAAKWLRDRHEDKTEAFVTWIDGDADAMISDWQKTSSQSQACGPVRGTQNCISVAERAGQIED